MSKSTIKIFVRKAGPFNAKNLKPSSQFGHIMIYIDDKFYSFTQNRFLPEGTEGCVQIMESEDFKKEYIGQIWQVVELKINENIKQDVYNYFRGKAKKAKYSLVSNCTRHCQTALRVAGISFPRDFVFPGSVLKSLLNRKDQLPIVSIKTVVV